MWYSGKLTYFDKIRDQNENKNKKNSVNRKYMILKHATYEMRDIQIYYPFFAQRILSKIN